MFAAPRMNFLAHRTGKQAAAKHRRGSLCDSVAETLIAWRVAWHK